MRLTPLDIHHKEFRLTLRGYSQEEVDQFLDEVADEFERLFKENIDQAEKLEAANEKVRSYAEIEKTLHNTMLAAQTSAEDIKAKAAKEAEVLLRDAEIKAKEMVQGALSERQRTQSEFMRIKQSEDEFRMTFRSVLEEYLRNLHEIPVAQDVASLVGIADPAEVEPAGATEQVLVSDAAQAPAETAPAEAAAQVAEADFAAPDATALTEADVAQPDDESARPHAQAGRRPGENTEPIPLEPPQTGFVRGLALGEVEGPDLTSETPTFTDPAEFPLPRFGTVGERDDDLDIEQID